jgi:hypothetical protein
MDQFLNFVEEKKYMDLAMSNIVRKPYAMTVVLNQIQDIEQLAKSNLELFKVCLDNISQMDLDLTSMRQTDL